MRFEQQVEIDAPQQRVWDVLTEIDAWPRRLETVDAVARLTDGPFRVGSRVRLRQPKLPEGVWEVTAWDAPAFFEWVQSTTGMTITAGHRVEPLGEGRSRLTLTIEMRGLLAPVMGRLSKGLTTGYMRTEAETMKRDAEAARARE